MEMQKGADWRKIQQRNFTRWQPLADFLELDEELRKQILTKSSFPLNLPYRLAEKVTKNTLNDPILKQFLPIDKELMRSEDFMPDPVRDESFRKEGKLLKKYESRALLLTSSACAMHCRFCFRQHFSYEGGVGNYSKELQLIKEDLSLAEIILSGGDPLSLSNEVLSKLLLQLDEIRHLKRLRFHTRFPVGIPERIDEDFLQMLSRLRLQTWFILHCNHPNELDDDVIKALKRVQKLGIPILNQTVLLKDINDDLPTLKALCLRLADHGMVPYYLHQLDKVEGASHFEVEETKGRFLQQQLLESLSGYAVPRYVKEIPGQLSKSLI